MTDMIDTAASPLDARQGFRPARTWPAVGAVAVGTFAVVTSELVAVGLLRPVSDAMAVSAGTAGLAMTATGVVAAVAAPLLMIAGGRLNRKTALLAMAALLALASAVQAAAPDFAVLMAGRVLVGLALGGFFAVAAGLGSRLAPPGQVGKATAVIFSGVAAAAVLGVPLTTLLAEGLGWRSAFIALAALSLAVLAAVAVLVPSLPAAGAVRFGTLRQMLRYGPMRTSLLALALAVTGHFAAFTYVTPALGEAAGLGQGPAAALLLAYGAAGMAGNFAMPALAARSLRWTATGALAVVAAAAALLPAVAVGAGAAVAVLLVWGLGYGPVPSALQMWNMRVSGQFHGDQHLEAGSALYVAVFNAAIAAGSAVGGGMVDAAAPSAALWTGAAIAALAAAVLGAAGRRLS
ncbi:MFS transporter [Streptomyces boninensis]|uniref:MFS transporter n=1 Tax=Streptomyces boninensis TaxID=2039455 RepID=UPI003B210224